MSRSFNKGHFCRGIAKYEKNNNATKHGLAQAGNLRIWSHASFDGLWTPVHFWSLPWRPQGEIFVIPYWLMPIKERGTVLQHWTWPFISVLRTSNKWEVKQMWQEVITQVRFPKGVAAAPTSLLSDSQMLHWSLLFDACFFAKFYIYIKFSFLRRRKFLLRQAISEMGVDEWEHFLGGHSERQVLYCVLQGATVKEDFRMRILSVLKTEADLIN